MKRFKPKSKHSDTTFALYAPIGLIVISLIIIPALISLSTPDLATFISLLTLIIALPFLVLKVITERRIIELGYGVESKEKRFIDISSFIALFVSLLGIASAIWHISWIICIFFVLSTIVAVGLFVSYADQMNKLEEELLSKKEESDGKPQ